MTALVEDEASGLPALIREECQDLLAQNSEKAARIAERTAKLVSLGAGSGHIFTHPLSHDLQLDFCGGQTILKER